MIPFQGGVYAYSKTDTSWARNLHRLRSVCQLPIIFFVFIYCSINSTNFTEFLDKKYLPWRQDILSSSRRGPLFRVLQCTVQSVDEILQQRQMWWRRLMKPSWFPFLMIWSTLSTTLLIFQPLMSTLQTPWICSSSLKLHAIATQCPLNCFIWSHSCQ